jgi:hypothetical protein
MPIKNMDGYLDLRQLRYFVDPCLIGIAVFCPVRNEAEDRSCQTRRQRQERLDVLRQGFPNPYVMR